MNNNTILHTIVGLSLLGSVHAQEAQKTVENLGDSVVTASRVQESVLDSSYSVTLLNADDVLEKSLRTIPEALRYSAGVLIQKTTHGHGSPYIRGFTGRQNLLLVDGIRMNNSSYRSGPIQYWNTLDANAISRMELVRGPSSVLYGSDSLGGTLNILSKSSGFENELGWFDRGNLFYKYDTNSGSHTGRLEEQFGVGGKWGASLGLSLKDFGEIRDSNLGRMKNTGYQEQSFDMKLEYALSSTSKLTLAHQYLNQDDVWRWHSTKFNPGWIHGNHVTQSGTLDERIYDQERSLTYLRLDGESSHQLMRQWETTLSYQKSQDSERRDGRFSNLDVDTFGLAFQSRGDLGNGEIVWGFDYYYDEVNSQANEPRRRPVADDASYDTLGAFAQYKWEVSDKLELSTGLRVSHFSADWGKVFNRSTGLDESGDGDWSNAALSVRANYEINEKNHLFGGVSQGFRAPNLEDLTGSNISNSSDEVVGSAGVDSEDVISFETGVKHESNTLRLTSSVFYTAINNPITSVVDNTGADRLLRITNGEDGYIYGVELEGEYHINDQWKLSANITYQDGKQDTLDEIGGVVTSDTIRRLSPLAGSASLRWAHPNDKVWVEATVLAATTQNNLGAGDLRDGQRVPTNGTPGYLIGTMRAGWQARENMLFTLGLENLTDEDYRVHGSGVNETGFNTVLGVKFSW
ncbi:MAG: hemoglobin/transferrin/lactoferrin receptor protein [Rubritalea sp.]|jgi:hemoglobin/transferrin/lactoferrin receptor protein